MLKVIASTGMFLVIDSLSLSLSLTCQQTGFSHLAEGEENADCRKTRASCKETQKEDAPRGFEGAQARNISPRNEQALTDSDLVHLSWNVVRTVLAYLYLIITKLNQAELKPNIWLLSPQMKGRDQLRVYMCLVGG